MMVSNRTFLWATYAGVGLAMASACSRSDDTEADSDPVTTGDGDGDGDAGNMGGVRGDGDGDGHGDGAGGSPPASGGSLFGFGGTPPVTYVCDGRVTVSDGSVPLIDDFEHVGSNAVVQAEGRAGDWYQLADATAGGVQLPAEGAVATAGVGRDGSAGFMASATGFTSDWGARFGLTLNSTFGTCGYDASAYDGVTFWIKGLPGKQQALRISAEMPDVLPIADGGTCEAGCYNAHFKAFVISNDQWQEVTLLWGDFKQDPGWGTQVPFDPANITQFAFSVGRSPGSYDIVLDDLAFLEKDNGAGGAGGASTD